MIVLQLRGHIVAEFISQFARKGTYEQPAAHADTTVYAPNGEIDLRFAQRFVPRHHMLIDAVDQRSVEVKNQASIVRLHAYILASLRRSPR